MRTNPILINKTETRKNFLEGCLIDIKSLKRISDPCPTCTIWDIDNLDIAIAYYLNNKLNTAVEEASTNMTDNQHTVPRFINESFGLHIAQKEKITKKYFHKDQSLDVEFTTGIKSLVLHENKDFLSLGQASTRKISIYDKIYDLPKNKYADLPDKTVECLAKGIETDAGEIIAALVKNPRMDVTLYQRIVLSCYCLLQLLRTEFRLSINKKIYEEIINFTEEFNEKSSAKLDPEKDTVVQELKKAQEEFGLYILSGFTLEILNLIFARDWSFIKAPHGLIITENPFALYNFSYRTNGGLINNKFYMLPLNRNLLWSLEGPPFENKRVADNAMPLDENENRFIVQLFSESPEMDKFCHPDDGEWIIKNLDKDVDFSKIRWHNLLE